MQTPYSKQRARQMEALRWSSPSPSMHDAAERWTDASGTTQMELRKLPPSVQRKTLRVTKEIRRGTEQQIDE